MTSTEALPAWLRSRLTGHAPGRATTKVLVALGTHARQMAYASTTEAADIAGVNAATVVRAAQMLGFAGWPQLRAESRSRYLSRLSASEVLVEHEGEDRDAVRAAVLQDLHNLQDLTALLDADSVRRAATHVQGAGTTLTLGSGSFAAPAVQLSHLGQTIGYDVRVELGGGTRLYNAVAGLGPGDCLVAYQIWRTPNDVLGACEVASERGAAVVVITDQSPHPTALGADEVIMIPSEGASMFPSLVGAMSVTQALVAAVIDIDRAGARRASDEREALWRARAVFPDMQ